jgi:hypothetical protein
VTTSARLRRGQATPLLGGAAAMSL